MLRPFRILLGNSSPFVSLTENFRSSLEIGLSHFIFPYLMDLSTLYPRMMALAAFVNRTLARISFVRNGAGNSRYFVPYMYGRAEL